MKSAKAEDRTPMVDSSVNSYNSESHGFVSDVQRFCIHDGPGIRTTVFLKGCPLSCQWCGNPELINTHPDIMVYDLRCIRCGRCVEACPKKAITLGKVMKINRLRCDLCLNCSQVCPTGAIKAIGQFLTVDQVLSEIEKDDLFYRNSDGGVTISGGEPLLQWRFVRNLLKECRQQGIHTALDTSGYTSWDIFREVLEYTDLCLYDLKHVEAHNHMRGTGRNNRRIIENLYLVASSVRMWLRVPIIPGYNDSRANIMNLIEIAKKANVEKISLLPYHDYGRAKYESLGKNYRCGQVKPPCNGDLQGLAEPLRNAGINVTIGD